MIGIFWCRVSCFHDVMEVGETGLTSKTDVWFHRYEDGVDIEGRFDYNSWQESEVGRRLSNSLDRNVVLAEGKAPLNMISDNEKPN